MIKYERPQLIEPQRRLSEPRRFIQVLTGPRLELLASVGLVMGLQKHAGEIVRSRGSSPKLQVLDTSLITRRPGYPSDPRVDPAL